MIFDWQLKSLQSSTVIMNGEVEADTQEDAQRILKKERNINPHTGEVLEIITPLDLTENGSSEGLILR